MARIIAARQADGFLCTKFILDAPETRWDDNRKSHALYSAGHLFEAGVAYFDATGRSGLLEASCHYADLIGARFGSGKVYDVPGHQEIELALIKLYRATGERRYLDLAKFFPDERGFVHGGPERVRSEKPRAADYNQDRVPLSRETRAVGHAVRAGYTYAAMADIAALCGERNCQQALDRIWHDVVERKLYITGASATGQYDDVGFGDAYCLPNETAYCETCGTIATVLWNRGDGYMDVWLARTVAAATPLPAATAGAQARVSASVKHPAGRLAALNDRRAGPSSGFRATPRFCWPEKSTGRQWVQYEWDKPRKLSRTAVFWAVDTPSQVYWRERTRGLVLKLPKSSILLYKDGNQWHPAETRDTYGMQPDRSDAIRFVPVTTRAIRLETEMSDTPCGIQEWLVD